MLSQLTLYLLVQKRQFWPHICLVNSHGTTCVWKVSSIVLSQFLSLSWLAPKMYCFRLCSEALPLFKQSSRTEVMLWCFFKARKLQEMRASHVPSLDAAVRWNFWTLHLKCGFWPPILCSLHNSEPTLAIKCQYWRHICV